MNKIRMLIGLCIVSANAYSGNPSCTGKISGVSLSSTGSVYATIKNGTTVNLSDVSFCNVNSVDGDYSGESCKAVLSLLMAGSAMDKTATMWFKTASFDSCIQSWGSLKASEFYHFRIN